MWRSAVQVCQGLQEEKAGGLAQLARAPALQAGGQRFESVILHTEAQTRPEKVIDMMEQKRREREERDLLTRES